MKPLPSSAERGADEAFRVRRVDALRTRRGQLQASTWAAIAGVVLVAAIVTAARTSTEGPLDTEGRAPKITKSVPLRQAGTGCVGWPLSLTPSKQPTATAKTIVVWGTRDAFHLQNASSSTAVIDVVATDGSLVLVQGDGKQVGDDHLRVELGPGFEASFTAACGATSLRLSGKTGSGAALGAGAFELGTGQANAPLQIAKVLRR